MRFIVSFVVAEARGRGVAGARGCKCVSPIELNEWLWWRMVGRGKPFYGPLSRLRDLFFLFKLFLDNYRFILKSTAK